MKTIARKKGSVSAAHLKSTVFGKLLRYKIHFVAVFLIAFIEIGYQRNVDVSYDSNQRMADKNYMEFISTNDELSLVNILTAKPETWILINKVYQMNSYKPLWTRGFEWNENGLSLLTLLRNSRYYGLDPSLYPLDRIDTLASLMNTDISLDDKTSLRFQVETNLTDAAIRFMVHLSKGIKYADTVDFQGSNTLITELPDVLIQAIHSGHFDNILLNLQPEFYEYVKLQQALEKYLDEVTLTTNYSYIPDPKLDSANCYATARIVMKELGYYVTDSNENEIIATANAIKSFQRFHGLTVDGKIGRGTINALAISTMDRYNKIAMTLEKMRQMDDLTSDGLFVNIPSFKLRIFENNIIVDEYRVIVGNPKTPTPELVSTMQTIITNPDWNVPPSITSNEILPKIKSDTTYLKAHNYTVYDLNGTEISPENIDWKNVSTENFNYFLKQDGDAGSALGKVKFLFPNEHSVYLHDTQSRGLFNLENRALSHGCIRVQNPEKLADYLLKRDNQVLEDGNSVKDLTDNKIARTFFLEKEIPVQFCYFTCEADDSCNIYFYNDIYNKDIQAHEALSIQQL